MLAVTAPDSRLLLPRDGNREPGAKTAVIY